MGVISRYPTNVEKWSAAPVSFMIIILAKTKCHMYSPKWCYSFLGAHLCAEAILSRKATTINSPLVRYTNTACFFSTMIKFSVSDGKLELFCRTQRKVTQQVALKSSASVDLQPHQTSPLEMYNPIYHPLVRITWSQWPVPAKALH